MCKGYLPGAFAQHRELCQLTVQLLLPNALQVASYPSVYQFSCHGHVVIRTLLVARKVP